MSSYPIRVSEAVERFVRLMRLSKPDWEGRELIELGNSLGVNSSLEQLNASTLRRVYSSIVSNSPEHQRQQLVSSLSSFLRFCYEMGFSCLEPGMALKGNLGKKNAARSQAPGDQNRIIYLSREGKERAEEELDHLINNQRPRVAKWLSIAAPDSGPGRPAFDHPKEIQSLIEGRIAELGSYLRSAFVIEEAREAFLFPQCINIGDTVELSEARKKVRYTLLGAFEVNPAKGWISFRSPIGQSLMGRLVGDELQLRVPAGDLRLQVLKLERIEIKYNEALHLIDYVGQSY